MFKINNKPGAPSFLAALRRSPKRAAVSPDYVQWVKNAVSLGDVDGLRLLGDMEDQPVLLHADEGAERAVLECAVAALLGSRNCAGVFMALSRALGFTGAQLRRHGLVTTAISNAALGDHVAVLEELAAWWRISKEDVFSSNLNLIELARLGRGCVIQHLVHKWGWGAHLPCSYIILAKNGADSAEKEPGEHSDAAFDHRIARVELDLLFYRSMHALPASERAAAVDIRTLALAGNLRLLQTLRSAWGFHKYFSCEQIDAVIREVEEAGGPREVAHELVEWRARVQPRESESETLN